VLAHGRGVLLGVRGERVEELGPLGTLVAGDLQSPARAEERQPCRPAGRGHRGLAEEAGVLEIERLACGVPRGPEVLLRLLLCGLRRLVGGLALASSAHVSVVAQRSDPDRLRAGAAGGAVAGWRP